MALIRERKERYGERGNRLAGAFCYSSDCRTVDCGLTSIWFAGGALAALVLELLGVDLIWQIGAFILVSFVLVYFTRPFAVKYVNAHHEKTNYEQAVGKIVRITQRVDDLAQTGKGILDGMEWTVRTDSKEVLEKDTLARVIRISGVKLIVEPYKED